MGKKFPGGSAAAGCQTTAAGLEAGCGLNKGPGAHKNWKTYEGLPVLSMAQAEAMDFRLDLERSAERCSIVRLTGKFDKKDIFKVEDRTCKKKGRRSLFLNPCFGETWWLAVAASWLGSRTPSMTSPIAVHQIWLVDLEKSICWPGIFRQRQLKAYVPQCRRSEWAKLKRSSRLLK